jgi:hypothetical protein
MQGMLKLTKSSLLKGVAPLKNLILLLKFKNLVMKTLVNFVYFSKMEDFYNYFYSNLYLLFS